MTFTVYCNSDFKEFNGKIQWSIAFYVMWSISFHVSIKGSKYYFQNELFGALKRNKAKCFIQKFIEMKVEIFLWESMP